MNSTPAWPYRIAYSLWAIGFGTVGFLLLQAWGMVLFRLGSFPVAEDPHAILRAVPGFLVLAAIGAGHATVRFFTSWTDWRLVDDCGDRLARILNAGRHVAVVTEEDEWRRFGGGLSRSSGSTSPSPASSSTGRRSLVAKLHPDRWHSATPSVRRAREEALKRVNAAYDQLRPRAA